MKKRAPWTRNSPTVKAKFKAGQVLIARDVANEEPPLPLTIVRVGKRMSRVVYWFQGKARYENWGNIQLNEIACRINGVQRMLRMLK